MELEAYLEPSRTPTMEKKKKIKKTKSVWNKTMFEKKERQNC